MREQSEYGCREQGDQHRQRLAHVVAERNHRWQVNDLDADDALDGSNWIWQRRDRVVARLHERDVDVSHVGGDRAVTEVDDARGSVGNDESER